MRPRCSAASLLELLVAMAALAVIVVMTAQLIERTSDLARSLNQRIASESQVRLLFDRLAVDLARMPRRPDVDYSGFKQPANIQTGNDSLEFYSETNGFYTGAAKLHSSDRSALSRVRYQTTPQLPGLARHCEMLGWEPEREGAWRSMVFIPGSALTHSLAATTNATRIAPDVIRMEYAYLCAPVPEKGREGPDIPLSVSPWAVSAGNSHGFQAVAAVVVALVVIDPATGALLGSRGCAELVDRFPDAADGGDLERTWNTILPGLPGPARQRVRVFQRVIPMAAPR